MALRCSKGMRSVNVDMTNLLAKTTAVIQPSIVIAELQQVTVVPAITAREKSKVGTEQEFLNNFNLRETECLKNRCRKSTSFS